MEKFVSAVMIFLILIGYDYFFKDNSKSEKKSVQQQQEQPVKKQQENRKDFFCIVEGIGKVKGTMQNDIGIAICKISEQKTIRESMSYTMKAKGKFVVLDVVVENNWKYPIEFYDSKFHLIDENGIDDMANDLKFMQIIDADNVADLLFIKDELLRRKLDKEALNHGLVQDLGIIFEVPEDYDVSKAKLKYEISIPLQFKGEDLNWWRYKDDKAVITPVKVEIVQ